MSKPVRPCARWHISIGCHLGNMKHKIM